MRISEISPVWERRGREVPVGGTSGGLVVRGPSCEICPGGKSEEEFTSIRGFPGGPVVKNPPAGAGDMGSIPGSGRSPGERNVNPLQYSWRILWTEEPGGLQSIGSPTKQQTKTPSIHSAACPREIAGCRH